MELTTNSDVLFVTILGGCNRRHALHIATLVTDTGLGVQVQQIVK